MKKRQDVSDFTKLRREFDENLFNILKGKVNKQFPAQAKVIKIIKKTYGVDVNPGDISKYYNNKNSPPPVVLMAMAQAADISIAELMENAFNEMQKKRRLNDEKATDSVQESASELDDGSLLKITTAASKALITNPSDMAFQGYLGSYYAYFTPTFSSGKGLLKGQLTLNPVGQAVRAHFELETTHRNEDGNIAKKVYDGSFVYSSAVTCCYCILSSKDVGEMCFLMFNHFQINHQNLDCCLAVSMTASAGGAERSPTIHRMLLSRDEIRDADLDELAPLLKLNNSELVIPQYALEELAKSNSEYAAVMKHILSSSKQETQPHYRLRETMIREMAQSTGKMLENDTVPLIAALRAAAVSSRYNKVSWKADKLVHDFLIGKGYYKRK